MAPNPHIGRRTNPILIYNLTQFLSNLYKIIPKNSWYITDVIRFFVAIKDKKQKLMEIVLIEKVKIHISWQT